MKVICPTCNGRGRIPDPKIGYGVPMCYYDPNTGDSFPHVACQSCGTSGWVDVANIKQ